MLLLIILPRTVFEQVFKRGENLSCGSIQPGLVAGVKAFNEAKVSAMRCDHHYSLSIVLKLLVRQSCMDSEAIIRVLKAGQQ